MAIICYNGKFVTTAKSLEMNVAVVTRADCIFNGLAGKMYSAEHRYIHKI
jgi:hypothetical protein